MLFLTVLLEGPVVLVALLAELFYFFRLGVLRSHPVRVAIAMLATTVGGLLLSGVVAVLLPASLQPTHYEPVALPLILLPGLISCALLAPPLFWWAAQRRKILVRVVAVLYLCAAGAGYYEMGPSSRSPVRLARGVSGLKVPADARALEFHDQASGPFDSDLVIAEGEREARAELGDDRAGGYHYVRTGARSYNIAVLDSVRGRLYIRILVM